MKRKTLISYLISEVLPPFFLGLLAFTFILLIGRLLKLIELVISRGVPPLQVGKLLVLIMPTFLEMTVPMAFLLAILLGLGRMANDQELLAMKASGVSPLQILWPIAGLSLVISILALVTTLYARPTANAALKKELYNIAKSRVSTALKEKIFNDDFPKILIYVEEIIPPGNTAQGIFIIDKRDRVREDIILGKVARITTDDEANTLGLRLFDGSIYEREKKRPGFSQTRFNIYDFKLDLEELVGPVRQKEAGPKELASEDLLKSIEDKQRRGGQIDSRANGVAPADRIRFCPFGVWRPWRSLGAAATRLASESLVGIHVVLVLAVGLLCFTLLRQGFGRQGKPAPHSSAMAAQPNHRLHRPGLLSKGDA